MTEIRLQNPYVDDVIKVREKLWTNCKNVRMARTRQYRVP